MRLELAQLLILFVLLVQSAAAQSGRMVITSVDVTSDSSLSSDHLRAITEEATKNTYTGNQPGEEFAERARYLLQQDGYFKAEVSLAEQFVSPTQSLKSGVKFSAST